MPILKFITEDYFHKHKNLINILQRILKQKLFTKCIENAKLGFRDLESWRNAFVRSDDAKVQIKIRECTSESN